MEDKPKKKRGFAAINPERAREIQRMGGKVSGGNFKNDRARARKAGRLGGQNSRKRYVASKEGK